MSVCFWLGFSIESFKKENNRRATKLPPWVKMNYAENWKKEEIILKLKNRLAPQRCVTWKREPARAAQRCRQEGPPPWSPESRCCARTRKRCTPPPDARNKQTMMRLRGPNRACECFSRAHLYVVDSQRQQRPEQEGAGAAVHAASQEAVQVDVVGGDGSVGSQGGQPEDTHGAAVNKNHLWGRHPVWL